MQTRCLLLFLGVSLLGQMSGAQGVAEAPENADVARVEKTAAIGVLAYRGSEFAITEWQPLATYLTDSVEGWRFEIIPLTLSSVQRGIENKQIEFLTTNPGHFVTLAAEHDLSAIATRERWANAAQAYLSRFGTTIFVSSDSKIASLNDLKGKSVAAVSPDAFGGFQIAWREIQKQGVDVFRDLETLRFVGFPHDQIVTAVASDEVQAGIVRSGLLERLAEEGAIDIDSFRVLNLQQHHDTPYQTSSALYPEWPLATLPGTDKGLRDSVLRSLVQTQDRAIALKYGLQDIWSAPLSYEGPRKLVSAYQHRVTAAEGQALLIRFSLIVLVVLAALSIYLFALYRRRVGSTQIPKNRDMSLEVPKEFRVYRKRLQSLTARETEVLNLICAGRQTKTIAIELGISPKTVEFHRSNLLHKTEAATMAHLVQIATRLGHT